MRKEGKARVLDEKEVKRLFAVAKNAQMPERNVAMLALSFGLGLRAKEIASLKISDVIDERGKLREEICLRCAVTKGEKQRFAYLSNQGVIKKITPYLKTITTTNIDNPLFLTQRNSKFTPDSMQKWFKRLYIEAGIEGASSHSGRRTYITRLIEQGVDIKAVSHLAGHSSILTTSIYIEDNPKRLKRIAATVNI